MSPKRKRDESSNAVRPPSERRSRRKPTSPPDQEKSSPVAERENPGSETGREEKDQEPNAENQLTATSERPGPEQVTPEHGSGAEQNAEFVRSPASFVHYRDKIPQEYDDGKPESRTAFEAKAQALMETMRSASMSINEIARLWKMSKAGVWNRVGHIQPKLSAPPPSSLSQPAPSSAPSAPPPMILDVSDSTEDETVETKQSESETNGSSGTYSYERRGGPATPLVDEATVRRLIMMFGEDCMRQGYDDFVPYFREIVIPKTRNYEYWSAYLPGRTDEEKTRNLIRYLKAAKKYFQQGDEYAKFENESITHNDGVGLEPRQS